MSNVLCLDHVSRSFTQAHGGTLDVLVNVDLTLMPNELVALVGPSGSGKSTLLHIAGLLEPPTQGQVTVGGVTSKGMTAAQKDQLRSAKIGFVYQYHHLLPEFTALENIMIPQLILGVPKKAAHLRSAELLERMRLQDRGHHYPGQLSGGEQQRVAIARAVANAPSLLLADEPTGNLDPITSEHVFTFFREIVREQQFAAFFATHNLGLAKAADRCVTLNQGVLTPCKL